MPKKIKIHPKIKHPSYLQSLSWSLIYFVIALSVNYIAGNYVNSISSKEAPDLLHSILPVVNTNLIFNQLAIVLWIYLGVLLVKNPKKAPFAIVSIATLILTRSFFLILTPEGHITTDQTQTSPLISFFSFKNDYFFSGHTAHPFMMALLFWKNKTERIIFLTLSIIFGIAVILGRMHYTVDVVAAYFITYCVYVFCKNYFSNDFHMFRGY